MHNIDLWLKISRWACNPASQTGQLWLGNEVNHSSIHLVQWMFVLFNYLSEFRPVSCCDCATHVPWFMSDMGCGRFGKDRFGKIRTTIGWNRRWPKQSWNDNIWSLVAQKYTEMFDHCARGPELRAQNGGIKSVHVSDICTGEWEALPGVTQI